MMGCMDCGYCEVADPLTLELLAVLTPLGVVLECECGAHLENLDELQPVKMRDDGTDENN